jgi:hypothetical protein
MGAMSEDPLDYTQLLREALLDVPRRALRIAAREGLPGEHHFYLSFRTTHPGVSISPSLRARHREEMTVVLQHQYWDLAVGEDAFSVTLRFGGVPERLHVPFDALVGFVDPAGKFGLRFDRPGEARVVQEEAPRTGTEPAEDDESTAAADPPAENVVDIRAFRRPGDDGADDGEPEPTG